MLQPFYFLCSLGFRDQHVNESADVCTQGCFFFICLVSDVAFRLWICVLILKVRFFQMHCCFWNCSLNLKILNWGVLGDKSVFDHLFWSHKRSEFNATEICSCPVFTDLLRHNQKWLKMTKADRKSLIKTVGMNMTTHLPQGNHGLFLITIKFLLRKQHYIIQVSVSPDIQTWLETSTSFTPCF